MVGLIEVENYFRQPTRMVEDRWMMVGSVELVRRFHAPMEIVDGRRLMVGSTGLTMCSNKFPREMIDVHIWASIRFARNFGFRKRIFDRSIVDGDQINNTNCLSH